MSKKVEITFISDFENNKKGQTQEFSRDIASIFVNELKVAQYGKIEKKPKTEK